MYLYIEKREWEVENGSKHFSEHFPRLSIWEKREALKCTETLMKKFLQKLQENCII